jgi:hypothetical protein
MLAGRCPLQEELQNQLEYVAGSELRKTKTPKEIKKQMETLPF